MHDVEADWCHDGSIHHWYADKLVGESDTAFAKRAGAELTQALKDFPVTNDC